jgi:hypothetical protein
MLMVRIAVIITQKELVRISARTVGITTAIGAYCETNGSGKKNPTSKLDATAAK